MNNWRNCRIIGLRVDNVSSKLWTSTPPPPIKNLKIFKIMNKFKNKILLFIFLLLLIPIFVFAENNLELKNENGETFRAKVIEIIEDNESIRDDGSVAINQKLRLKGLDGSFKDKEIIFDGTKIDVLSAIKYKINNKVIVNYSKGPDNEDNFYVIGFDRSNAIYLLVIIFVLIVLIVGKFKGLRSLVTLFLTFIIILKFIIPKILTGSNPLFITIIGSFLILILTIYITEGIKRTSTIAIFSILISLVIVGLFSVWFTAIIKLTGFASEESIYLISIFGGDINLNGLLLAGIIIGALGVLDDVAISQVVVVEELKKANSELSKSQVYHKAMKVGISHLSSMVNTLFLAYAGASLPLLILFNINEPPFLTFSQIINNEIITTEIVRTLIGSIGIILAVPISTLIAVEFIKKNK